MNKKLKSLNIAVIPIDSRPVCYDLIKDTLDVHKSINYFLPQKEILGSINKKANLSKILNWLKDLKELDYIVVSLDTIAYGGLISSRKSNDSFDEIKDNIDRFFKVLEKKSVKVFAFSSILRISNSNINEEEKEYWNIYGEKIFEYSYLSSKGETKSLPKIPEEILSDYLNTRKRNFGINKYYLELKNQGMIDYLIFSKDDTSEFGFNIEESKELQKSGAIVKTGADEVPLALISRILVGFYNKKVEFDLIYSNQNGKNIISRYEDITIKESVKSQIDTANCLEGRGVKVFLNCPNTIQNDYALDIFEDEQQEVIIPQDIDVIIDIAAANGCDKGFMDEFLLQKREILSFSGWNTTSNSIGSALFIHKQLFLADLLFGLKNNCHNKIY